MFNMEVFSRSMTVHANRFKRRVISRKGFTRMKSRICPFKTTLPNERPKWVINVIDHGKLPTNRKRKHASYQGTKEWKVIGINRDVQPNGSGGLSHQSADKVQKLDMARASDEVDSSESDLPSRELETSNPTTVTFDNGNFVQSSGSVSGCELRSLGSYLRLSSESSIDSAEFHHIMGKRYFLILRYPSRLHFRGVISVTPIIGSTSFLGYEFPSGLTPHLVFSPKGTSPLYLQAVGKLNKEDTKRVPKIPGVESSILNRVGLRDSAILIEPAFGEQWEKLFGSFASMFSFNPLIANAREKKRAPSDVDVQANLRVEFVQPGDSVVSSRLHNESSEWDHLSEAVLNEDREKGPIRLMAFGGKGVGKSTFMRFMVNRWLSKCKRRRTNGGLNFQESSVLFVDFDPGQSEFIPPGCISATLVTEPLLGPNYTHLKDPERMICIGDLNVEKCPDWYLKCADELLKFCNSNPALRNIPWFINTMGFCRGIGADLAVKLIQLCHPTHVIQLTSRFSRRNFDPIDLLSWQSVNSWRGMEWNPSISSPKGSQVPEYFYHQLWSLAERPVAENYVRGVAENGAKAGPFQDSDEMEDIDSEWGLPAWQSRDLSILAYFSRMVSGPKYSLLQPTPHVIKLSDLILSLPSPLLKPQMITAAFNARLVAICGFERSQEVINLSENHIPEAEDCEVQCEPITQRTKPAWEKVLKPNNSEHPRVLFHMPLAPCLGFGIVRAIDNIGHCLFLTSPVEKNVLASVTCLATSPSMGSLPKDLYFEPLKLDTKRENSIPYTVMCDRNSTLSRAVPRVFNVPSKVLPANKA